MTYSSIDNKRIKDIKKLHQKKYRDEMNMFLVEGEHLVKEAYISGYLDSIILLEGTTFSLSKNDIYVTDKVMRYLSALDNYQPVMGICHKKEKKDLQNRLLLLDDIQDPGNLGTIIRSAVAFGFDSIILGLKTTDLYSSKVIRATQGLLFHINIFSMDLKELIREIKPNYYVIGTRVDGGEEITKFENHDKIALVMGNEGQGVSSDILAMCDAYGYIPMREQCESLNVGVAASIMMYELSR